MIISYIDTLIGVVPPGFEFLTYIFGFILVLAGLYLIVQLVTAFIDLIR